MQIGELARRASLTVDAIRFYEKRKLLPKADRSTGHFRRFTEEAVERLHFIQLMQKLGFSLQEIAELIELRSHRIDACAAVRTRLKAKIETVRGKIRELRQLESELASDLRKCDRELNHRQGHVPGPCPVLEEAAEGVHR